MKRLLILLLAVAFAGCGRRPAERFTIGVSQCSEDLWRTTVNTEMMREASFYPEMKVVIRSVRDDTAQQIRDIEELIDSGIDLLVVSPNEAEAITPVVGKAFRMDIPVILFDRKINSDDYTAYIGADNYQLAYELGLYVGDILGGCGNVVEIRGWSGATADKERHEGFRDAIAQYPKISVVAERNGDFLRGVAEKRMLEVLRETTEPIDLVFAMNDPMALGVHSATTNFSGTRPFIVGIDAVAGEGGGIESIRKGLIDASFIYPTGGDRVIDLAYRILNGQPHERENILNTAVVDRSNARVIQLQTDQIAQHQEKIDKANSSLSATMARYTSQRTLLIASVILLVGVILLLTMQFVAYKSKIRTNRTLEKQNREIRLQAAELQRQKEQLLALQRQLEEATQAKLVFFTNISHEFRTPLSLILGPVEALLSDSTLTTAQHEMLSLMHRNSRRLLSLISEIIEFRTVENGKVKTCFVRGDLRGFIDEMNVSFLDYAVRRGVGFSFETELPELEAVFDREKFEKIYFNLLSNAFKHTSPGKSIKVGLGMQESGGSRFARLIVFNEGKSIPADKLENIFERFFKVNNNDTGTGIGLALTRMLVEDVHRGRITAESSEGYGTTFTVLLPLEQSGVEISCDGDSGMPFSGLDTDLLESPQVVTPGEIFDKDARNMTGKPIALVIEDNADLRRFMRMILQEEYTVVEADDGGPGIDMAKKYIPDVVISDVMMPGVDGFEVCLTLKEHVATSLIPVILLTACSLDEQKAIGFERGADAYIPKPFNAELLKIRVRKLIENRRKAKEAFSNTLVDDSKQATLADTEQRFLDAFRAYINKHISDHNLNVDDIAREMGLSRVQLYRKVKSITNYSPNELVRIYRLKRAAHLLAAGAKNVAEVAYETGFSSPSYFTKCFKDFYKKSPTEYADAKSGI